MPEHADRLADSLASNRLDLAELAAYIDEYHGPKHDDSPTLRSLGDRPVCWTTLMSWPSPLTVLLWPHGEHVFEFRGRHFEPTVATRLLDVAVEAAERGAIPAEGGLRLERSVPANDPLPHFDSALVTCEHGFHKDLPTLAARTVRVAPVVHWEVPDVIDAKTLGQHTGKSGRLSLVAWEREPFPFVRLRVVDKAVPYRQTKQPFVTRAEALLGYVEQYLRHGRAEIWDRNERCLTIEGAPGDVTWSLDESSEATCPHATLAPLVRAFLEGDDRDSLARVSLGG